MKKTLIILVGSIVLAITPLLSAKAQMAQGNPSGDNHAAREEAQGAGVWQQLQAKKLACEDLSEEDFQALGEYVMGQQLGSAHEAMNAMLAQMIGETGEEQAHAALGKRASNCEPNAPLPASLQNSGMMLMMNMMTGGGMSGWAAAPWWRGGGYVMMGNFGFMPFGGGWLFMILWWLLVIAGLAALARWIVNQKQGGGKPASALEILKERYARGEISKEEFEAKKRDIAS